MNKWNKYFNVENIQEIEFFILNNFNLVRKKKKK